MHLRRRALEEPATAADEQRVAREDGAVVGGRVFEQVADAVLGVAGRVECFDLDAAADAECLAVGGRRGHLCAVLAADDG